MAEVWPSLGYMHSGVSFTPYREQFQQLIGKPVHYLRKCTMPVRASLLHRMCPVRRYAAVYRPWHFYGVYAR